MRRTFFMLAAAVLAALPPAVAGAVREPGSAPGEAPGAAAAPAAVPAGKAAGDPLAAFAAGLARGRELTFPLPDVPGPATLSPRVEALVAGAAPGALLDLVVTLDRPADDRLAGALGRLAVWSRTFEHLPAAGLRLPVARLTELRNLRGVLAVYDDQKLQYFLKESATLNNATPAWNDLGITGKGVTVAILDTGIDFTHPDLAPAMKANVKLAGFGQDPTPTIPVEGLPNSDTSSGHGTHVAGDAAGRGTASGGEQKGMAYGADLVGIGAGDALSIFTALEGFDWLLENRDKYDIRVVNNSYGTGFAPFDPMDPVHLATKRATDAGVVVVFANGNDGDEMSMNPYATAPWVLPVAAGSKTGKVTDFSSGGIEADTVGMDFSKVEIEGEARTPLNMGLYHPAVTATGEDVVSTRSNTTLTPVTALPDDLRNLPPGQVPYYHTLSGTSMAAPEAAGIAALVLEANPALTPAQVRMVLQITARPIPGTPFHEQGYGHADAAAAVELARSLAGRPAADIQSALEDRQAARDRGVLDGLAHPARTYGYTDRAPTVVGTLEYKIQVAPGSERIKVVTNGGTLPLVGGTTYDIAVTDAAARDVGSISASESSGTTALDLDLRKLDLDEAKAAERFEALTYGEWTVEVSTFGSLVPPMDTGHVDDLAAKRFITTLISVFGAQPKPCSPLVKFTPLNVREFRFQDDKATGGPFPPNPEFTYVGPVPDGTLGNRTPERRLAATFGQATSSGKEPQFTTAPLGGPLTVGGVGELRAFIQGTGEAVAGLVSADLIAVDRTGGVAIIGQSTERVAAKTSTTEPTEIKVPIAIAVPRTVPAGHRIAVRFRITFVGTSGHTLFYDSDEYPSGVTFQTGEIITEECPAVTDPARVPVSRTPSRRD